MTFSKQKSGAKSAIEGYVVNHLRLFLSLCAGLLILLGLTATAVFFITIQGAEETMVPELRNKELTQALLELQAKELYPRIQLRYSDAAGEKGLILEQDPKAGTIVKAGRRIRLVVSQGVVLSMVEDYRGRNINEVQMDLRTLFASAQPLLSLKEPFMYQFSPDEPGTILQQSPEPGTPLSGPTTLELVVSRGPERRTITVPDLIGLPVSDALKKLSDGNIRFQFSLLPVRQGERAETIVQQDPAPSTPADSGVRLSLVASAPLEPVNGEIFTLFTYTLPENSYPLPIRLEAQLPSGEHRLLVELNHSGGELSIPYRAPPGSFIILFMLNREFYREELLPPLESFSVDQL